MSLSLMISGAAAVQAQSLVKDINSGTNGCQQGEVVKVGANVLFRANDQSPWFSMACRAASTMPRHHEHAVRKHLSYA